MPIKNLIFDLGGVLFAIDMQRAFEALRALIPDAETRGIPRNLRDIADHPVFRDFETGALEPAGFREGLRSSFGVQGSDAQIDAAWNALLLGVIPGRIAHLQQLARSYRLVLLSNTNLTHVRHYAKEVKPLFACFEHCYLSYEMGLRKPDAAIYQQVLAEQKMHAEESVFIDDSSVNIQGAGKVGLQAFLIGNAVGATFEDFLSKFSS